MSNCKYCGKESYNRPFCPDCGKKYFGVILEVPVDKDNKKRIDDSKIDNTRYDDYAQQTRRMCIYCTKRALTGSVFCEQHKVEYYKNQNNNSYNSFIDENFEYILKSITSFNNNSKKDDITLCKICNMNSHGKTYCYGCYKKIINGQIRMPKEYDNLKYKCKNGNLVRSQGERTISDFLFENKIPHEYEEKITYYEIDLLTKKTRNKSIRPDFYIKGPIIYNNKKIENVYIEYFGLEGNQKYDETNLYKKKVYDSLKTTVIIVYPKDIENYETSLSYKLTEYKQNEINFLNEG